MYILILLVILICLLWRMNKKNIVEGYDARFDEMDMIGCADFCKTHSNCYGFGFDKVNRVCYPSESALGGYPKDSIFKDEYKTSNVVCNKFKTIQNANNKPLFTDRRMNAIYICREGETDHPKYYYHNNGNLHDIGDGRMIDQIIDVQEYKVLPYVWSKDKYDYNQNDLLLQMLSKQNILPSNVTNAEQIDNYKAPIIIHHEGSKTNNKKTDFLENDNFNTGEYLMDYKCVKDTDKNICMNSCANNDNCNGFEFNPSYKNDKDVCCLYHNVGSFVKRDDDKKNGKFYQKIIR